MEGAQNSQFQRHQLQFFKVKYSSSCKDMYCTSIRIRTIYGIPIRDFTKTTHNEISRTSKASLHSLINYTEEEKLLNNENQKKIHT